MPTTPARFARRAAGVAATAWVALVLMAHFFPARFDLPDAQVDAAMLAERRVKQELPPPAELFPLDNSAVAVRRWTGGGEDAPMTLETRTLGMRRVGAERGVALESRLNGQPLQTEVYRVDGRGVFGLATGRDASVTLAPPLPLLPARETLSGHVREWRGALLTEGGSRTTPARALCRVDGPERVVTPAGAFPRAYRVDLQVWVGGGPSAAPAVSTLWLVPGVGVVRQQLPLGKEGASVMLALDAPAKARVAW